MFRRPTLLADIRDLERFACGTPSLDQYLRQRAADNQAKGYARTYVIATADYRVVGYSSLCSGMISRENAPRQVTGHGAPSDIPVILLARLAVDTEYQGHGLGADLLRHAFMMAILSAQSIGVSAMLVHAKDEKAAGFYGRYGFRPARGLERTMLCPIKDMIAALTEAKAGR